MHNSTNLLLIAEQNYIRLWDILSNTVIRTLESSESVENDFLVIENAMGNSNYFIVLLLNSIVLKMIDSN
jgi:hypothetical protein